MMMNDCHYRFIKSYAFDVIVDGAAEGVISLDELALQRTHSSVA
jgi:hypothetical protein